MIISHRGRLFLDVANNDVIFNGGMHSLYLCKKSDALWIYQYPVNGSQWKTTLSYIICIALHLDNLGFLINLYLIWYDTGGFLCNPSIITAEYID